MIHHRFSVDRYEEMVRLGVLTENDRVELIRGEILEKMTIGPEHSACVKRLNRLLNTLFGSRVCLGVQDPIRLFDSEPEPDVSVARLSPDDYASGHPTAADLLLIIEVADSTLDFDRSQKLPIYAEAGIPEYWIVNLIDRQIEIYRGPQVDGEFSSQYIASSNDEVELLAFPGMRLAVNDILP